MDQRKWSESFRIFHQVLLQISMVNYILVFYSIMIQETYDGRIPIVEKHLYMNQ